MTEIETLRNATTNNELVEAVRELCHACDRSFPAASVIRYIEHAIGRRIVILDLPSLRENSKSGLLMILEDPLKPVFIFAPPPCVFVGDLKQKQVVHSMFHRFCIYHEVAHLLIEGLEGLTTVSEPYQETEDEWIRATRFAFALLNLRGRTKDRHILTPREALEIVNDLDAVEKALWFHHLQEIEQICENHRHSTPALKNNS
jgi:hypothetical protein